MYNTILVFFLFSIALSLRRRLTFMKIATLLNEFPFLFSFCSSIFIFLPLSEFDKFFFFFSYFFWFTSIYIKYSFMLIQFSQISMTSITLSHILPPIYFCISFYFLILILIYVLLSTENIPSIYCFFIFFFQILHPLDLAWMWKIGVLIICQ